MSKTLYIIDHSNWRVKFESVFTNYHVERNGVNVCTGSIAGFARSLKMLPFDDILIVLDGTPQNSLNVLPTYKGTRNHESRGVLSVSKTEEVMFLTKIGERLGKNVQVCCSPLQETDQVISSVTHYITHNLPERWKLTSMLNTKSLEDDARLDRYTPVQTSQISTDYLDQFDSVVIASTDADFVQLLRFDNVFIDTSTSGALITNERVTDSTSKLPPIQTILHKCIIGDVSDNVPRVPVRNPKQIHDIIMTVDTMDKLNEFFSVVDGTFMSVACSLDEMAFKLAQFINRYYKRQFNVNKQVTFCTFVSLPQVLRYENYEIEDTIVNYRLNV